MEQPFYYSQLFFLTGRIGSADLIYMIKWVDLFNRSFRKHFTVWSWGNCASSHVIYRWKSVYVYF